MIAHLPTPQLLLRTNHSSHVTLYKSADGSYVVLMGRNQKLLISENLQHYYEYGLTSTQVWYIPFCSRPPKNQVSGLTPLFVPESSHES